MLNWRRSRCVAENTKLAPVPDRSGTDADPVPDRSAIATPVFPSEHARLFLQWMQTPGGRVGWIPAAELMNAYAEFTAERGIAPLGWVAVGRELRRLLGARKTYAWLTGRKVRVYRIPPTGSPPLAVIGQGGEIGAVD
jgi:hypothetical protein